MAKHYTLEILNQAVINVAELNKLRLRYARIANERLRNLEKAGRAFWAYDTAINYTQNAYGRNRFNESQKWRGTIPGMVEELQNITEFLNMETSTVRGSRAVDRRITNTFRKEHGLKISNPREFFAFLNSAQYRQLANSGITSEQLQEYFDRSREDGYTIPEIYDELESFQSEKIETVEELFNRHGFSTLKDD